MYSDAPVAEPRIAVGVASRTVGADELISSLVVLVLRMLVEVLIAKAVEVDVTVKKFVPMTVRVTVRVATGALNERSILVKDNIVLSLDEFGKAEVGEVAEIGLGKNVELDELVDNKVNAVSPFGLVDVADICEPEVVEDDGIDEVLIEEDVVLNMEDWIEDARRVVDTMDDVKRLVEDIVLDMEVLIEEDVVLDMEDWIEDARRVVDTMDDVERLVEDIVLDKKVTGVEEVDSDEEAVLEAIVTAVEDLVGDGVGRFEDKAALGDEVDEANGLVVASASDELYGLVAGFVRRMLVLEALDFVEEIPVEPRVLEARSPLPDVKEL
ncbi:MAG: hypothetical protein Q9204_007866 [Flavoplaca sp. TL-2023a]